jgi:hypothetical protein
MNKATCIQQMVLKIEKLNMVIMLFVFRIISHVASYSPRYSKNYEFPEVLMTLLKANLLTIEVSTGISSNMNP